MQSSVSLQYLVGSSTFIGQTQTSGPVFTSVCTICSQHSANPQGFYQSYCSALLYLSIRTQLNNLSIRTQLINHLPNSYKIVMKVKAKTNLMTSSLYVIIVTDTWLYTGTHRQEYFNSYLDWKKDLIKKIPLLQNRSLYLTIVMDATPNTGTYRHEFCNSYLDWKILLLWIFDPFLLSHPVLFTVPLILPSFSSFYLTIAQMKNLQKCLEEATKKLRRWGR